MAKRVLITGASGLLGRAIFREFKSDSSWTVCGLAFSRAGEDLVRVDLTCREAVDKVVEDFKPQVIIHSAAERRVDVIEKYPEKAQKTNIGATTFICEAAAKIGAWVVFISTDYVFDGKSPPYKVTDTPNPLNTYGQSKLAGERLTLETSKDNSVLRVPILYGQIENLAESAVTVLFEKVKDTSAPAKMCNIQRRFPTHCDDVAYILRELADKRLQLGDISGIFHWSNDENLTKYDLALTMATVFNLPSNHLVADDSGPGLANRPLNAQLDCSRVEALGICKRTPYKQGIVNVLKPFL